MESNTENCTLTEFSMGPIYGSQVFAPHWSSPFIYFFGKHCDGRVNTISSDRLLGH